METLLDESFSNIDKNARFNLADNSNRSTSAQVSIFIYGFLSLLSLLISLDYSRSIQQESSSPLFMNSNADLIECFNLLSRFMSFSYLVAAIFFLRWYKRAYVNLNGLGIDRKDSTNWAVAYFFIPLLNWIMTHGIIREIIHGNSQSLQKIGLNSTYDDRKRMLTIWWTLFILTPLSGFILSFFLRLFSPEHWYIVSNYQGAIQLLFNIGLSTIAVISIRAISKDEKLLFDFSSNSTS